MIYTIIIISILSLLIFLGGLIDISFMEKDAVIMEEKEQVDQIIFFVPSDNLT